MYLWKRGKVCPQEGGGVVPAPDSFSEHDTLLLLYVQKHVTVMHIMRSSEPICHSVMEM